MTAKIFKPLICVFTVISLLLGVCFTASAEESDGHITVSTVTAVNGDSVIIKFDMSENPGTMAMTISITYDSSALTFEKEYIGYLRDRTYQVADHPEQNLIRFVDCEAGNSFRNGTFLSLQFKVKDTASFGFYPVSIDYKEGDFCNWKLKKLMPKITAGGVNIEFNGKNCPHKKYGEWETAAPAGCTEQGAEQRACLKCGHIEIRKTDPVGHEFAKEWTIDKAATKDSSGTMSRHCIRCDATTDLLTFTLKDAEDNKLENEPLKEVKPSDFTDRLKEEQKPEETIDTAEPDGNGDTNGNTDKSIINSIPAEKGSAIDKIISGLPNGIKQLEKVFIATAVLLFELLFLLI